MTKCRRCADCKGMSHHWMTNDEFGDDEADAGSAGAEYCCKHCDALGNMCDYCFGDGCALCSQEGVCEL